MRARNLCFTSFKIVEEKSLIDYAIKDNRVEYLIYQIEKCPTTEKLHYQGYVEFKQPMTLGQVKTIFNDNSMHLELRRGTQKQAIDYCMKDESKVAGPFEYGNKKEQGFRNDIEEIYEDVTEGYTLKEILKKHKGNAVRMIHAIEKTALIHHGFNSLDSWILLKRKEESKKDKLDLKIEEDLEKKLLEKN